MQFLGNHSNTASDIAPIPLLQIVTFQENPPFLGAVDTAEQAQQGCLTRTIWPQQSNHLACPRLQMYIIQEWLASITEGDAIYNEKGPLWGYAGANFHIYHR
jgi:hypothetical protein